MSFASGAVAHQWPFLLLHLLRRRQGNSRLRKRSVTYVHKWSTRDRLTNVQARAVRRTTVEKKTEGKRMRPDATTEASNCKQHDWFKMHSFIESFIIMRWDRKTDLPSCLGNCRVHASLPVSCWASACLCATLACLVLGLTSSRWASQSSTSPVDNFSLPPSP